ncbi:hypothetical protein HZA43_00745 [Candidatus Peregrinibacteria bacterium]|nr:hypothetical protein [Candidatus Peregrinibacteria bacterium]
MIRPSPQQYENLAVETLKGILTSLHPSAREQLEHSVYHARKWVSEQFAARLKGEQGRAVTEVIPLNETERLGCQRIVLHLRRAGDDQDLLISGRDKEGIEYIEDRSPSIDILAPGMIAGPHRLGEVEIAIEERHGIKLSNLSSFNDLHIREAYPQNHSKKGETLPEVPLIFLAKGNERTVWTARGGVLRVLMEAHPDRIRKDPPLGRGLASGTCGVQFLVEASA